LNASDKARNVNLLMRTLDEKSGQIITYLLRERHAEIRKLADLICASSDMEVLTKIKEVINPRAQKIIGEPLITFEKSKIDPLTGEKITFSWWLKEELMEDAHHEMLLDVFDEEDCLRVVACLPPQERNVDVEVEGDFLIISGKDYHMEVPLFYTVEKMVRKTIKNGVLEVKLNKWDEKTCQ
jgi:HSP20 family molecular chaperone IbpA